MSARETQLKLELKKVQELYSKMQADKKALQQQLKEFKTQTGSAADVVAKILPSLVSVYVMDWDTGEEISSGSGFFVFPDIIVTNYHVVGDIESGERLELIEEHVAPGDRAAERNRTVALGALNGRADIVEEVELPACDRLKSRVNRRVNTARVGHDAFNLGADRGQPHE